jgi:hypothetical protein
MGRNSAQRTTHSDAWPSLWPRHSSARGLVAEPAHSLCGLPAGTARVVAWSAAALPWLRWGSWGARASTVEGPPAGQVGEGGSSPDLLADGKGQKNRDGGGVLRRGGCSGGRRGPASGWEGRGGSGTGIPGEKGSKGGARGSGHHGVGHDGGGGRSSSDRVAPCSQLLHRWGEGGEGRRPSLEKTAVVRRHGEGGGVVDIQTQEQNTAGQQGDGAQTRSVGRCSDSVVVARLRTIEAARSALDRHYQAAFMA